jgi:hypothetical protein
LRQGPFLSSGALSLILQDLELLNLTRQVFC